MKFEPMDYRAEWQKALDNAEASLGLSEVAEMTREDAKRAIVKALPQYLLMCFCEGVRMTDAKRWEPLEGLRAAHHYLIQKHQWSPQTVEALGVDQLCLALNPELRELDLSPQARAPFWSDVVHYRIQGLDLEPKNGGGSGV